MTPQGRRWAILRAGEIDILMTQIQTGWGATMTRTAAVVAAIVLAFLLSPLSAQNQSSTTPRQPSVTVGEVHVLPVKGNVYMVVGAGGNIAIQVGEDGVLMVDTGTARAADQVLAAVRQVTSKPIRWILNTHAHSDHTGGNQAIAGAGSGILQPNATERALRTASIVAHDNVLLRLNAPAGGEAPMPGVALPALTYLETSREMYFNDEPVILTHGADAHTDGDSIVFFRRSDVVVAGDVYSNASYPVIDVTTGGTINGSIEALNQLLDVMVSKEKAEGGTYVIPGHGRLADEADVFAYRNMVTIIRDRIQELKGRGMSLDQVKAARPTLDYDLRYATQALTAERFVETVYQTLPEPRTPARAAAGQRR